MREIILNEREWAENMIETVDLGRKPSETLSCLARYYHSSGYRKQEIAKLLEQHVLRCDPLCSLANWQECIDKLARSADKYPLVEVSGISVTRTEMQKIVELEGKQRRKVMFALLCLAKFQNAARPANNNWVNYDSRTIFALANVVITNKRKALLLNDLKQLGYVGFSRQVDNVNLNIKIVDDNPDIEIVVSDFRNIGNQLLRYLGEDFIECQNCGLVIRRTSPTHKYCADCAVGINRAKSLDRFRAMNSASAG